MAKTISSILGLGLVALASTLSGQSATIAERLAALEIVIPERAGGPVANYVPAVRTGDLVFLAGAVPRGPDGAFLVGKLGADYTVEQGYAAARTTAVALMAALQGELGDLERVVRIVRVDGMVNATPDFTQHSAVLNGCSDLLVEVFGERGRHTRTAVGMSSLPFGVPCEIAMVVEVADAPTE